MASSSVEDYASLPSSHNTERGKGYEKRTKERNKINKKQLASLERNDQGNLKNLARMRLCKKIFMRGDLIDDSDVEEQDPVETEKEDNPPTTSCGQSGQDHPKESENAAKRQKYDVPTNCQFSICGADLQCKRNFESTSGEFNVCTGCSKWYHKQCFDMESTGPNRLNCGCSRTAITLRSKQKFRSKEGLAYLFRFWNSKIKKYFKELETGKRFSQRFHLFKNGQYRKLEKESLDYTWLVGDDLVLAFMLHKEEGFPIAHGWRLLSQPEDGNPAN
eukprot:gene14645-16165_t